MGYDDDDYLDSLRGRQPRLLSRGNPHGNSNYAIGGAKAFGTTAPAFVSDIAHRTHTRTTRSGDTQASRFDTLLLASPRLCSWNNNHVVNTKKKWGSLEGPFPALALLTEIVKIKHAI